MEETSFLKKRTRETFDNRPKPIQLDDALTSVDRSCSDSTNLINDESLDNAGIYFITSREFYNERSWKEGSRIFIKAGSSEKLRDRLDSYHLYYPKGYYLFGILKVVKSKLQAFENHIGYLFSGNRIGRSDRKHGHLLEWYEIDRQELKKAFLYLKAFTADQKCFDFIDRPTFVEAVKDITLPRRHIKHTPNIQTEGILFLSSSESQYYLQNHIEDLLIDK